MSLLHSRNHPLLRFSAPPQLGVEEADSNSLVSHASSWLQPNPRSRTTGWRPEALVQCRIAGEGGGPTQEREERDEKDTSGEEDKHQGSFFHIYIYIHNY
jgi:hypothetical protein